MTQKKSFTLKHGKNPCEEYKAKRLLWLKKFLYALGVVLFVVILILPNVDFDGTKYGTHHATKPNHTAKNTYKILISHENMTHTTVDVEKVNDEKYIKSQTINVTSKAGVSWNHSSFKQDETCTYSKDPCIVNCSNKNIKAVDNFLISQQKICEKNMDLTLNNITFSKEDALKISLKIQRLHIYAGNLTDLEEGFFGAFIFENLESLEIVNCNLPEVNNNIFQGLKSLKHLALLYVGVSETKLNHPTFLQPLFPTLEDIALNFQLTDPTICYPEDWFLQSANYKNLRRVILSGNNFHDSLSEKSFVMLTAVEELILSHCNITFLQKDTFKGIEKTLKFLDLSHNQLTTVTGLENNVFMKNTLLTVNLMENPWHCNCSNAEFMSIMATDKILMKETAYCATTTVKNISTVKDLAEKCATNDQEKNNLTGIKLFDYVLPAEPSFVLNDYNANIISIACIKPFSVNNWKEIEMHAADNQFVVRQTKPQTANVTVFGALKDNFVLFVKSLQSHQLVNDCSTSKGTMAYYLYKDTNRTQTHIEVSPLVRGSNYLFFLARLNDNTITPFNCEAFHEGKTLPRNIWLRNKDKCLVFSLSIFILIFSSLLPFGITFFLVRYRKKINKKSYERFHRNSDHSYSTLDKSNTSEEYLSGFYEKYNKIRLSIESAAPNEVAPRLPYHYAHGIRSLTEDNIYANSLYEDFYEQLE